MYFITKRNSATGKKFQELEKLQKEAFKAQKDLANELGFSKFRVGGFCIAGGISSVLFEKEPDLKIWRKKKEKNEYMPRLNNKEGREIMSRISSLPKVSWARLNKCIGWNEMWKSIGFAPNNKTYFGFSTDDDWKIRIPKDCTEITFTRYKKLFGK